MIKKIPINKFDLIYTEFSIHPAYLLGLVDDLAVEPDDASCYFWEHPRNKFECIKDELDLENYFIAMDFDGNPLNQLLSNVTEKLKNDYELLLALNNIFKGPSYQRTLMIDIIKKLGKI